MIYQFIMIILMYRQKNASHLFDDCDTMLQVLDCCQEP